MTVPPLNGSSPYGPILTGIGVLNAGKISDSAKAAFVSDVILLLTNGNANGATLSPIGSIFPLPPVPGPEVPVLVPPGLEPIFWFGPDPTAPLQEPALLSEADTPFWHQIFIDGLFQGTATALDLAGNTPLFPMFDISAPFQLPPLPLPFTLPDLAAALKLPVPKLLLKLPTLGIQLSLPSISIPSIPIPALPKLPPLPMLPQFLLGLFQLPFQLLLKLLVPPDISLIFDLPNLPAAVFKVAFGLILDLFISLGIPSPFPLLPKAFIASIIVYLKNVIAMVCCVIVGNIVGMGAMAQTVGVTLGLLK
jgi:hypothetical protein